MGSSSIRIQIQVLKQKLSQECTYTYRHWQIVPPLPLTFTIKLPFQGTEYRQNWWGWKFANGTMATEKH